MIDFSFTLGIETPSEIAKTLYKVIPMCGVVIKKSETHQFVQQFRQDLQKELALYCQAQISEIAVVEHEKKIRGIPVEILITDPDNYFSVCSFVESKTRIQTILLSLQQKHPQRYSNLILDTKSVQRYNAKHKSKSSAIVPDISKTFGNVPRTSQQNTSDN